MRLEPPDSVLSGALHHRRALLPRVSGRVLRTACATQIKLTVMPTSRVALRTRACALYADFSSLLGRAALNVACPQGRVNCKQRDICGASRAADTTDERSRAAPRRKAHQRTARAAQSAAAPVPEQSGALLGARSIFLYYQSDGAFRILPGSRECAALA